ncbi:MAG: Formamidopyrimidine-DNA glycosylase [Desulfovibrio sp.]
MPELPEVETVARTLRPHVQGSIIADAHVLRATSLHPLSLPLQRLRGCRIADVARRGKLLLLLLDPEKAEDAEVRGMKDLRLAVHLRMTGRLMTYAAKTAPGTHTRCIFDLTALPVGALAAAQGQAAEEHGPVAAAAGMPASHPCSPTDGRRLFFDDVRAFGTLLAGTPEVFARWPFWRDLGPEPLEITEAAFAERIAQKRSAIKAVLLDQKVLAGVGNIYADESLFAAGIDPRRKASELTRAEALRLLHCLRDVLLLSISQCGSSIRDYRDADGNVGAFQNSFAVYGRGGQKCKSCAGFLEKARVAGRGTVFCPRCQR